MSLMFVTFHNFTIPIKVRGDFLWKAQGGMRKGHEEARPPHLRTVPLQVPPPFKILKLGKNYRIKYSCYFAYETYPLLTKS